MDKTIIYIEDNEINADIVDRMLRKRGYSIIIAPDGSSGIALTQEHQPDLIICDFQLPDMLAPEIIESIRATTELEKIPIIMLTADTTNRALSMEAGADAYFNKPVRRNQLLEAIEKLI